MLRRLQNFNGKNIDAQTTAGAAMVKGMLVQKNLVTGTAILPLSQEGLYFVDKDNQPMGLMAYEGEISEYDDRLVKIASGDPVQLEKPISGERYATDQFTATGLAVGNYLIAVVAPGATQGFLIKNATATPFKYGGTVVENGHTLAIVEVI